MAVPGVVAVELRCVRIGGAQQERAFTVGIERPGRELRVQILEPVPRQVVTELRVRRAADPQRMPRAEYVVLEAGLRDLRRLDRAAEPVVAFEDADVPA